MATASKVGQAARKPAAKKTTTTAPKAPAKAKAGGVQPAHEASTAGNILAMLVVLGLTLWALTMNSILPNQSAPAHSARPAVHAQPVAPTSGGTCEARNAEAMQRGMPPVDCGGAK